MVDLRKRVDSPSMCSDNAGRRTSFPSIKFRLREERKRVIRMSKTKYHNIQDHETTMRQFCLIRNTLQRLQRDVREEKLARHNAKANNVSPSYLSASRPRSPSPPCDMEVADMISEYGQPTPYPITALSDDEDDMPPCKRLRLTKFEEKENQIQKAYEDRLANEVGKKFESNSMDETHEILREVYESYTGENLSQPLTSPQSSQYHTETSHNMSYCSTTTDLSCEFNISSTFFDNSEYSRLSESADWSRTQHQYPCSHSAFQGNDLKSVVYQSLITSL